MLRLALGVLPWLAYPYERSTKKSGVGCAA